MSAYEGLPAEKTTETETYRSRVHADDRPDRTFGSARHRGLLSLKIEEVAMAACMAGIALITAANVATRYLTDISLAFTEEFSVALMVMTAMIGTSYAVARRRHISIDYLINKLPPRHRRVVNLMILAATASCFLIVFIYGVQLAYDEYRYGVLTPGLGYPSWVFTMWMPTFSALVLIRVAERAWSVFAEGDRSWNG